MTVVVFGSVRGSPGVTSAALLVAGALPAGVVIEADVDGGTLAVRYGLGREPGLTTMVAARSTEPEGWRHHAQLAGGVPVVVGPDSPDSAEALWARAGGSVARTAAATDATMVVDIGRLRNASPLRALGPVADLVVVLVQPRAEGMVALSHRLPFVRSAGAPVVAATIGEGPYRPDEVAGQFDVPLLGALPADRRAAEMLTGRGGTRRGLARTPLVRAAGEIADAIQARVQPPADRTDARRQPAAGVWA